MRDNLADADLTYSIFKTDMGWVGVMGTAQGLRRTTLPQHTEEEVRDLLGDVVKYACPSSRRFGDVIERLKLYFSGHKVNFACELDLSEATPFQRLVWNSTKTIPYGETRSYTWLAQQINKPKAVRAVGQALGRNPLPIIIPCHRVLAVDGELGGFSGGLEMKRRLLKLESEVIF